ncbi:MAG: acyltransferase family protein [Muribaculaceae bacterium]|nr:acyltransferase family protein [Muribaculaceae bacterium]
MVLTLVVLIFTIFALFWRVRLRNYASDIMSDAFDFPTTHLLKGIAAIIVVMIHFPEAYTNPLQKCIGSYAYIAVTYFFFVSAYGMEYSYNHRPDYLRRFWINRLSGLLIPMFLVNVLAYGYCLINRLHYAERWTELLKFNHYVTILLEYCVLFYLLYKIIVTRWIAQSILIAVVTGSSLYYYFTLDSWSTSVWPFERMGLVWGLLAYKYRSQMIVWMSRKNVRKAITLIFMTGLLGVAYIKFKPIYFWGAYLLKVALGVSFMLTIFTCAQYLKFNNPIGRFLGNISYEIYLLHGLVMVYIIYITPEINSGMLVFITFICSITVGWVISRISSRLVRSIKKFL